MKLETVQGATRPVVTVLFALAVVGGFFVGKISADQFIPLASSVLLWWFASRQATKPTDPTV